MTTGQLKPTERNTMDDTVATTVGNQIIELLSLPVKKNGRVDTTWGDKTPAGLARTIDRVLADLVPEFPHG